MNFISFKKPSVNKLTIW